MPYSTPEKRKEYSRQYKARKSDEIKTRRNELFAQHQRGKGIAPKSWAIGGYEHGFCATCGGGVTCRPLEGCTQSRHHHKYKLKQQKDKKYRLLRQTEAKDGIRPFRKTSEEGLIRRSERGRILYQIRRMALVDKFGGCCQNCGFEDYRVLELHHKEGGGSLHRKELGWRYHKSITDTPINQLKEIFQLLCANCHGIETYEQRKASPYTKKKGEGLVNAKVIP